MKILITGGLGNLGSWLTDYFCQTDNEVFVLAKNKRPILNDQNFEYISCDITSLEECKNAIQGKGFDVIIHAASVNDGFVDNYFKLAIDVNTLGTRNILEAIKDENIKHFIYLSTFQVYGKYAGNISEETPLETKNDYGNTHLFSEFYVKQFNQTHKLPYTIIRLTNSYGCPKDMNSSKWYLILNDLSKTAFYDKKIILKSNGQAPRDFIWMGDVCKIFDKLISHGPTNDIYNLSGEKSYRMVEIAEFVKSAYEKTFGEKIEVETNTEDKSSFPDGFHVSAQKLKSIISYDCNAHFEEEAIKIFEFLEKNQ